jgi:hypothetical protein
MRLWKHEESVSKIELAPIIWKRHVPLLCR